MHVLYVMYDKRKERERRQSRTVWFYDKRRVRVRREEESS